MFGHCRGVAIDLREAHNGLVRAMCTFVAGDRTIYEASA